MTPPPPCPPLFPYTTLFRSVVPVCARILDDLHREVIRSSSEPCSEREEDRKSTRLNSSHVAISYAVFCLKKKTDADLADRRQEVTAGHNDLAAAEQQSDPHP